jgi:hypothetical protein
VRVIVTVLPELLSKAGGLVSSVASNSRDPAWEFELMELKVIRTKTPYLFMIFI